jgi:hypothetical protein
MAAAKISIYGLILRMHGLIQIFTGRIGLMVFLQIIYARKNARVYKELELPALFTS